MEWLKGRLYWLELGRSVIVFKPGQVFPHQSCFEMLKTPFHSSFRLKASTKAALGIGTVTFLPYLSSGHHQDAAEQPLICQISVTGYLKTALMMYLPNTRGAELKWRHFVVFSINAPHKTDGAAMPDTLSFPL